jgi:hypothetical protein
VKINAIAYDGDLGPTDGSGISYVLFQLMQGATVVASLRENIKPYDWTLNTSSYADGAYTLKATAVSTTAAGGTSSSAVISINIANHAAARMLSEEDVASDEVTLYPNPAGNVVNINLPGKKWTSVEVQNPNGVTVIVQSAEDRETVSVDVTDLSAGVYYVKLKGKTVKVIKFIKR